MTSMHGILCGPKPFAKPFGQYSAVAVMAELQIRCVKFTSIDTTFVISSLNPMFDHLLELSHRDDSNLQMVKHRIWWRSRHYRNKNMLLIWSPV